MPAAWKDILSRSSTAIGKHRRKLPAVPMQRRLSMRASLSSASLLPTHEAQHVQDMEILAQLECDEPTLQKQFEMWDKDRSGFIDCDELKTALQNLGLKHTPAEVEEIMKNADADGSGHIDFAEFRKAVKTPSAAEKWILAMPLARLLATQMPVDEEDKSNPLAGLVALASRPDGRDEMDQVIDRVSSTIKELMWQRLMELKKSFDKGISVRADLPTNGGDKFSTINLEVGKSLGTIVDFHHGLEGRLGIPDADIWAGMEEEHCHMPNAHTQFTSCNYNITTTSHQEWTIVITGEVPNGYQKADGRVFRSLAQAMKIPCVHADSKGLNRLSRAEVASVILYTGPMYMVRNLPSSAPLAPCDSLRHCLPCMCMNVYSLASRRQTATQVSTVYGESPKRPPTRCTPARPCCR